MARRLPGATATAAAAQRGARATAPHRDPDHSVIQPPCFTRAGVLRGARQSVPLALGSVASGLVYGALARQAGIGFEAAVLTSGLVFAGTAQFVVLELWRAPLPVATIVATVLIVNARHLLMGAALRPWLGRLPARRAYASLFFLTDESWALTQRELTTGRRDAAVLVGSGLALAASWVGATAVGHALGVAVGHPPRWGLDFAATAVFAALLAGSGRGARSFVSWAVAGPVAVAAERWLPGTWYVLLGGAAGGLVGADRDGA